MALSASGIIELFENRAGQQYGQEAVTQLEHALQCAQLAQDAGETDATVVAGLLHDIGHLICAELGDHADDIQNHDDLHQYVALPFLRGLLPDAVLEPIRLHVDAKRYLCATEPCYFGTLSPASQRSLVLQGGPFEDKEIAAFLDQPFAHEAVRLRRYDDLAKEPGKKTPPLSYFAAKLHGLKLAISNP
jgi:phosphonate degradation associated HDIG domain protein